MNYWELEAQGNSEKMFLRDQFRLGKISCIHDLLEKSVKLEPDLLPNQGFIRLKKEQIEDYEW